jgi:hypothetical protein
MGELFGHGDLLADQEPALGEEKDGETAMGRASARSRFAPRVMQRQGSYGTYQEHLQEAATTLFRAENGPV